MELVLGSTHGAKAHPHLGLLSAPRKITDITSLSHRFWHCNSLFTIFLLLFLGLYHRLASWASSIFSNIIPSHTQAEALNSNAVNCVIRINFFPLCGDELDNVVVKTLSVGL